LCYRPNGGAHEGTASKSASRSISDGFGSQIELGRSEPIGISGGASFEDEFDLNGAVAQRAYRRFEERGRVHGRDLDDWLEAEKEIAAKESPRMTVL
jgi:hypothetical protein